MESIPRKRQKTPQAICGSDLKQLSSNTNRRNFTLITTDVMVYSENILTEEKISESGFSIHKNDLRCFWWKLAPTSFSCMYAFIPTIALTQGNQWWHTSCCIALPGWTGKKHFYTGCSDYEIQSRFTTAQQWHKELAGKIQAIARLGLERTLQIISFLHLHTGSLSIDIWCVWLKEVKMHPTLTTLVTKLR